MSSPESGKLAQALAHLRAGDWPRAHPLVQDDEAALACWAHGIVHALEGDLGNARYWYGRAQRAWPQPYDAAAEIDALAAAGKEKP